MSVSRRTVKMIVDRELKKINSGLTDFSNHKESVMSCLIRMGQPDNIKKTLSAVSFFTRYLNAYDDKCDDVVMDAAGLLSIYYRNSLVEAQIVSEEKLDYVVELVKKIINDDDNDSDRVEEFASGKRTEEAVRKIHASLDLKRLTIWQVVGLAIVAYALLMALVWLFQQASTGPQRTFWSLFKKQDGQFTVPEEESTAYSFLNDALRPLTENLTQKIAESAQSMLETASGIGQAGGRYNFENIDISQFGSEFENLSARMQCTRSGAGALGLGAWEPWQCKPMVDVDQSSDFTSMQQKMIMDHYVGKYGGRIASGKRTAQQLQWFSSLAYENIVTLTKSAIWYAPFQLFQDVYYRRNMGLGSKLRSNVTSLLVLGANACFYYGFGSVMASTFSTYQGGNLAMQSAFQVKRDIEIQASKAEWWNTIGNAAGDWTEAGLAALGNPLVVTAAPIAGAVLASGANYFTQSYAAGMRADADLKRELWNVGLSKAANFAYFAGDLATMGAIRNFSRPLKELFIDDRFEQLVSDKDISTATNWGGGDRTVAPIIP